MNDTNPARSTAERALLDHDSEVVSELAVAAVENGDVSYAIGLLEEACGLWTHPGLWHNLGRAREICGDINAAVEAFTKSIELGYRDSLVNRGWNFEQLGQYDSALADYDAALAIEPADVIALINSGTLLLDRGELDSAGDRLKRAVALDESAKWQLAAWLSAVGRVDDALEALDRAIELGENRARHDRAMLTQKTRSIADVSADFEAAIEAGSTPAAGDYVIYLGLVADDPDKAVEVGRAAAARGDELAYVPLGIILEMIGELREALRFYRLAVANGEVEYAEDIAELERKILDS